MSASGMGGGLGVTMILAAQASQFKQGLADASAALDGFGDNIARKIPVVDKFVGTLNKAAFALAATVGAIDAVTVKAASDIETPIQNVATVWDEAGQKVHGTFLSLADTTKQIIALSTQLPQSAASLAEGLYNVASSGFQGSDAMKVLDASARAASAGLTTTDVSGRAITAVLNAYGLSASKATDVSDTMFQVVNRGVLNFEELAQNMGDIAPLAAAAGISFDEAGSALAAMTLSGLPAAEAATSLSGVMRGLVDPSADMTAQLKELGYESGATALKQDGLIGVLNKLNKATHGQSDAWIKLFPDIRAARGAMAATAQDGAILADVAGSITDATGRAGSTEEALAKQSQSLSYQLQVLHNSVTAIAAGFGEALLPAVKLVVGIIQDTVSAFGNLPTPFLQAAAVVSNLLAVFTSLAAFLLGKWIAAKIFAAAISLLTTALGEASIAARVLNGTLTVLSVIGPAVTGLAIGFTLVSTAIANSEAHAKGLVDTLNKGLGDTGNTLQNLKDAVSANQAELDKANKSYEDWKVRTANPIKGIKNALVGMAGYLPFVRDRLFDAEAAQTGFGNSTQAAKDKLYTYQAVVQTLALRYGMTEDAVMALAEANNVDLTQSLNAALPGFAKAAGGMNAMDVAATKLKTILADIPKTFSLTTAWQQAQTDAATASQAVEKTAKEGITHRYNDLKDGLAKDERAEKESLTAQVKVRQDALDAEHKVITDALEARHRAEQDAYDDEARSEKEALDRQFRSEKEALDERLKLLDQEADARKKDEDRRWDTEKDQIQFMIDSTFGAEREGWKDRLIQGDKAHDDNLNQIDNANEKQKTTEKDGLDDRQTQDKDALDTRLRQTKENLADKENAEKDAEDTRYNNAKTALDLDTQQLQNQLDDKYGRLKTNLDDREKAESDAADTRFNVAAGKYKVSLSQYQTFLDDQTKKAEAFNQNMALIAARGGADVLAEVAKLPPEVVSQLATATPEAFDAFLESVRLSLVTGKPGAGLSVDTPIFHPPGGRALYADGGILRFADGGEYHDAQIASAGSWRVWAEPETGGEAYIPLAQSKRARSSSILGQVAEQFGYGLVQMAAGGILAGGSAAGPSGGGDININVSVENHLAPGIDMGVAGRMIEERVRSGVAAGIDGVRRQVLAKSWRSG